MALPLFKTVSPAIFGGPAMRENLTPRNNSSPPIHPKSFRLVLFCDSSLSQAKYQAKAKRNAAYTTIMETLINWDR
jgi:hypothetical protein